MNDDFLRVIAASPEARPGPFSMMPTQEMAEVLKRDYKAMAGMILETFPILNQ